MNRIKTLVQNNKFKILFFLGCFFLIPNIFIMGMSIDKISEYSEISDISEISDKKIAIVFGAAARGGYPSDIYADRLKVSAELYHQKKIQKILVSGDNRVEDYNEPQAGKIFLKTLGVASDDIVLDYAGLRTHDTCVRAKKYLE